MAGVFAGFGLAAISGVLAAVVGLRAFEGAFGSVGTLWVAYIGTGAVGGILGGLLSPIARTPIGAFVVGTLAVTPMSYVFGIRMFGPLAEWMLPHMLMSVTWTLAVGGLGGLRFLKMLREEPELSEW